MAKYSEESLRRLLEAINEPDSVIEKKIADATRELLLEYYSGKISPQDIAFAAVESELKTDPLMQRINAELNIPAKN